MKKLTTHVLDTASGIPGAGIKIELYRVDAQAQLVKTLTTNADGRTDEPFLDGGDFQCGTWELVFHVGAYFAARHSDLPQPPFLDQVTLRFSMADEAHYHVPLLASPWSYSTYRGS